MSASDYYTGAAFLLVTFGATFTGTEILVRRRLPALVGATRAIAWSVVATAAVLAVHLLPAAMGLLDRGPVLIAAVLFLGAAALVPAEPESARVGFPGPSRRGSPVDWAIAGLGVSAFCIWVVLAAAHHAFDSPVSYDAASAYFPTAGRWIQEGSIWEIADWVPDVFYGATPGNGTALTAGLMLPWDNDFLARFAVYPFVPLTALACYGLARELRAPAPAAALLGVMLAAVPVAVIPGLADFLHDPVMYFTLAAGLLFLARHHRTGHTADLTIAGLALGIAFGTKFYGYTSIPAVLAIWAGARLISKVGVAVVARQLAWAIGLVAAAGGIWALRNWIQTGNPAYPVAIGPLGLDAPDDPLRPLIGSTIASYIDDPGVWRDYLVHQFRIAIGLPLILLGVSALGAAALIARRWRAGVARTRDGMAATAIVIAAALAATYALTPYSAPGLEGVPNAAAVNARYGIPALIAAVPAAGYLAGRLGRNWLLAFEVACLACLFDALRVGTVTSRATVYAAFVIALVLVGLGWAAVQRWSAWPRLTMPGWAVAATAAAALGGVVVAGERAQDRYNADRYADLDPVLDAVIAAGGEDQRVGLAGTWSPTGVAPTFPSFGDRLDTRVDYVGPLEDGRLERYQERQPFVDAVTGSDYDLLVVGRAPAPGDTPAGDNGVGGTRETGWAASAGYREVASSDRFVLLARPEG